MSDGLNRVMLLGNCGADPELRFTQGGQAVLNIRLATSESYLDKDKVRRERTDWHSVTIWGKRGEALAKILAKGSTIFVEGSIRTSSYEDKEGVKRYKTEVNANNVILAGGKRDGAGASEDRPARLRSGWTAPTFGGGGAGARPPCAADVGGTDGKGSDDFGFGDNDADIPFATSLPNRRGL